MRRNCLLALGAFVVLLSGLSAEEKDQGKVDPDKLVGTWTYVSGERDGKKVPEENLKKGIVEITKETISLKSDEATFVIKYSLDTKKTPCGISMEITKGPQGEGAKAEGIISVSGDTLKLCYAPMGGDAPKEFSAKEDSKLHLFVLKKKK
jgi:uncharacterized protein (TIGR03067 family)